MIKITILLVHLLTNIMLQCPHLVLLMMQIALVAHLHLVLHLPPVEVPVHGVLIALQVHEGVQHGRRDHVVLVVFLG